MRLAKLRKILPQHDMDAILITVLLSFLLLLFGLLTWALIANRVDTLRLGRLTAGTRSSPVAHASGLAKIRGTVASGADLRSPPDGPRPGGRPGPHLDGVVGVLAHFAAARPNHRTSSGRPRRCRRTRSRAT